MRLLSFVCHYTTTFQRVQNYAVHSSAGALLEHEDEKELPMISPLFRAVS